MSSTTLEVTMPSDTEVAVTRTFDAPRDLVFRAFTEPALVQRWLLGPPGWSMPVCEIDLRVGGKFQYRWRSDEDGSEFGISGFFREIVPHERIVHTEVYSEDPTGTEAVVTSVWTEQDGKTTMQLTMRFPTKEARDGAVATGMTDGMAISYDRLADTLASMQAK